MVSFPSYLILHCLLFPITSGDYVYVNDNHVYHRGSEEFNGAYRNEHSTSGQRREDDDTSDDEPPSYPKEVVSVQISSAFSNKQSFSCPMAKPLLHTGESLADLSPEDIDIVAAMGDALPAGRGLWEATDVEFRGAAFPIGGDANIDGLVTIPSRLLQAENFIAEPTITSLIVLGRAFIMNTFASYAVRRFQYVSSNYAAELLETFGGSGRCGRGDTGFGM
ncbi:hypothetical protein Aduo_005475 [Ancylostoma duodenale]